MRKKTNSVSREHGIAALELALSLVFLTPLLLGAFVYGFKLIRSIEMIQITRDLAHMYDRGVDFRSATPQQNAQTLAGEYSLSSSGYCLIILSQIRLATQADCDAANPARIGQPCTNLGLPVFIQQVTIGNTANGGSVFGTPPLQSSPGNASDKTPTTINLGNNSAVQANGFATIVTLTAGQIVYVAEMINLTPEFTIPGLSGRPQVYARTIF